jgi:hypothetical protein
MGPSLSWRWRTARLSPQNVAAVFDLRDALRQSGAVERPPFVTSEYSNVTDA